MAGGDRIVRYNIAAKTSTVIASGPAATRFQLDNAGNVYVGGIQYDAITGHPTTLPTDFYALVAANGDLYQINNFDINRYSLTRPAAVPIPHEYTPEFLGEMANVPTSLSADPNGVAYFDSFVASGGAARHYSYKTSIGSSDITHIGPVDGPKVLAFDLAGSTYVATARRDCLDFEFCDASAVVTMFDPAGSVVASVPLDGLTVYSPRADPLSGDLRHLLVDSSGSLYAVTGTNSILKYPSSGGAGQNLATGPFTSVSITG